MAYGVPFAGLQLHSPLQGSGFKNDLDLFRYWADVLARYGPPGFYANASFADYTPGYLYALWVVGLVGHLVGGIGDLIKLPAILTDIALGYVVYSMARELRVTERRAAIAAAVVIVNPVTWFDSVVWGQVDSFGTVFLLLALRELWRGRSERSAILAVVAALIKPQLAILVPIVALVVIRRALTDPERGLGGLGLSVAPDAVARGVIYFPLVGAAVGTATALTAWALSHILPGTIAAMAAVAVGAVLTGALHLDGLAERPGGYTRIIHKGPRLGDAAPMVIIELVD